MNSPERVELREKWIKIWNYVEKFEPEMVLGWPSSLPDLTRAQEFENRASTDQCYFKQRERAELPPLFQSLRPNYTY